MLSDSIRVLVVSAGATIRPKYQRNRALYRGGQYERGHSHLHWFRFSVSYFSIFCNERIPEEACREIRLPIRLHARILNFKGRTSALELRVTTSRFLL